MADYIQIQKSLRYRRNRFRVRMKIFGIFMVLLIIPFVVFMHLPILYIRNIKVIGSKLSNTYNISQFINFEIFSSSGISKFIFGKKNFLLILVLSSKMEKALNELKIHYPIIKNADVEKYNIKTGSLTVKVEEREKYGIWCLDNDNIKDQPCFWFDKNGILFIPAPHTEGRLIKKIFDKYDGNMNIGEYIFDRERVGILLKIFDFLEISGLNIRTLCLDNRELDEIKTCDNNYPIIYFSLRFNPFVELPGLQKIYNDIDKLEYIDLRIKNRVFYK